MIPGDPPGLISVLSWIGVGVLFAFLVQWWRRYGSVNLDERFWAAHAAGARRFARVLLLPVGVDLAIRLALQPLAWSITGAADLFFNFIRVLCVLWCGYRVVHLGAGSPLSASLAGPIFLFLDHVVVKGLYLLVGGSLRPQERWMAFAGVLISFLVFVPVAALIAWCGGLVAGWRARRNAVAA